MGFFGKLPSRGDFVRVGLSRLATSAWDCWLSSVLPRAASSSPSWTDPLRTLRWRFAFGPGVCGPSAMTGLWFPSSDRVGRMFPLLIAAEAAGRSEDFLDTAEIIGTAAICDAMTPETLVRHLAAAPQPGPAMNDVGAAARWWRKGADAAEFEGEALPDADAFLRMLRS